MGSESTDTSGEYCKLVQQCDSDDFFMDSFEFGASEDEPIWPNITDYRPGRETGLCVVGFSDKTAVGNVCLRGWSDSFLASFHSGSSNTRCIARNSGHGVRG